MLGEGGLSMIVAFLVGFVVGIVLVTVIVYFVGKRQLERGAKVV